MAAADERCCLLTHTGVCVGVAARPDATGLLRRALEAGGRSRWSFAAHVLPVDALTLCEAALRPLHEIEPPPAEGDWFGPADPWRHREAWLDALGSWLGARTSTWAASRLEEATPPADSSCDVHDALELRHDRRSGRGLYLGSPCAAGALMLSEEAFAAVLRREHGATHCAHCLLPFGRLAVRCAGCAERYCSGACRAHASARGHAAECGVRFAAVAPVGAVLAARALLLLRPSDEAAATATAAEGASGAQRDGGAARRGWASGAADAACAACAGLQSHAARLPAARLSRLRLQAALCWRALGGALAARGHAPGAVLRLLGVAETNTIAVGAEVPAAPHRGAAGAGGAGAAGAEATVRVRLAEALYPRAALLNHACAPNAALRFDGRRLEVRACRALAAGTQLLGCYGPQAGHAPRAARRRELRAQYHFECACEACEAEAAAARGGAGGGGAGGAGAADALAAAAALDERARAACERGDDARAAALVERAVALLRRVFPAESSEVAHELAKLGRLRFNAAPGAAAARALREGAEALRVHYGDDEAEVRELRRLAALCARVPSA